ncbi:MAG TPA: hypothetical protein VLL30_17010, partial [Reyranella sp.]|nr:hypothetical protein [Reyranella sp.]
MDAERRELCLGVLQRFIFGPLQEIGNVINVYREAEVSLENFDKILQTPREPRPANPVVLTDISTLAFENVGFTHLTATQPALVDVSFEV